LRFEEPVADETQATNAVNEDEDGIHRLSDIVVEEVSLVDRAANKRRFLVVKRSAEKAVGSKVGIQHQPTKARRNKADKWEARKVEDETKMPTEEMPPAAGMDEASESAEMMDEIPAGGMDDSYMDGEIQKDEYWSDGEADGGYEEDAEYGGDSEYDDEDSDADYEEDSEDYDHSERSDDEHSEEYDEEYEDDESDEDEDQDEDDVYKDEEPVPLDRMFPVETKHALLRGLTAALERLLAVSKRLQDAPVSNQMVALPSDLASELGSICEDLEKTYADLGAPMMKRTLKKGHTPMTKTRMARYHKALALLSGLLTEMTDEEMPADPNEGLGEMVQKRDASVGIHKLASSIGALTRMVKRQEEELIRIRKARGVSNAIPVDGGSPRLDVKWPRDLNRPLSRGSAAKAVSFFDE
jgi:hypothetical protein